MELYFSCFPYQAEEETKKWPYNFPSLPDFPHANQHGEISGRLFVNDSGYGSSREMLPVNSSYVGLASRGDVGSWQEDSKGYQFWIRTNESGHFNIKGVRSGNYNLYAWVPGVIGDYKQHDDIIIQQGLFFTSTHVVSCSLITWSQTYIYMCPFRRPDFYR